ncbi:MAG: iron ABC transporter permease [Pseudomonadota bacterium]
MSRAALTLVLLGLATPLAAIWSLSVGAVSVPVSEIINTLFHLDGPRQEFIINRSRLPRTLLALLTGGALALSGTIIQALLRNPLASPKVIGINSGAALAVILAVMASPEIGLRWLPVSAAFGGIMAAGLVYALSNVRNVSPLRLALVGIAIGFLCDAWVDFFLVSADTYDISTPLVWMTGSLWSRGWDHVNAVWQALVLISLCCLILYHRLDLMRLGPEQAAGVGVNVKAERLLLLASASLLAALSVSVVGVVAFVGLMAPHIARKLVGGHHRALLPAAMLVGMILLVMADAVGRWIWPPVEVSAGILTALFGAPFFIFILLTVRGASE